MVGSAENANRGSIAKAELCADIAPRRAAAMDNVSLSGATRDALVDAISVALMAMVLTDGCRLDTDGVCGTLYFEREGTLLTGALILLGASLEDASGRCAAVCSSR